GLVEAEIVEWKVAVGDTVKVNDIVVEVETAKSLVELPIPWAGTVAALHVAVGDEVEVGTVIITIDDGAGSDSTGSDGSGSAVAAADVAQPATGEAGVPAEDAGVEEEPVKTLVGYGPMASGTTRRARKSAASSGGSPPPPPTSLAEHAEPSASSEASGRHTATSSSEQAGTGTSADAPTPKALAKPPVRKLAKDLGIDLASVPPTGAGGIVTRADVEAYAASAHSAGSGVNDGPGSPTSAPRSTSSHASAAAPQSGASVMPQDPGQLQSDVATTTAAALSGSDSPTSGSGRVVSTPPAWGSQGREIRIPIKGVRKMTAQAMVASAFTAPHVTEWVQVDVTATMDLVGRLKSDREFKDVKVTPLTILAKAICLAVKRNPGVNASWDEASQEIIEKHYVNLGIAAATPRGLIVPNIKDADSLTLIELAGALNALTGTARAGRTSPADQAGGTLTITNVGVFGVDGGTPILNPGEAAIMAFGQVRRMPWVITEGGEEKIVPRSVTTLALSFDHRLVDGELGSRFLADVAAIMSDPTRALVWG
ncbi:MAG TPA: dihydrolipoamide acetyltransferase family protein, partial [Phycicoccus sp.]|nr:dihydrolipoamide acetyltransferase family protein [Phycicoccus sp.]